MGSFEARKSLENSRGGGAKVSDSSFLDALRQRMIRE